ncbi:prepilin-type N-terminal cleavage/methylation domain-containing protein [Atopobacter phocae]|uniref:prepilin-type N-terminal cleavage/methylation domain-containing protein n=1 Tax=Atopobacter phocae TaxID=136492 RepID=UPI0004710FBD|nr:prepilin-type N-terminal cleavage/methylation domain-containing protein [Atopobacter phocae]
MKRLWLKLNNKKGFTIIEMLITLMIVFTIIVLSPKPNHQFTQQLENELTLKQFEHQIMLFQQQCLFTESPGIVRFYEYPFNQVIFISTHHAKKEIQTIQFPESLVILDTREIRFDSTGKSASVFTLAIQSNEILYHYRVQLGGGQLFRDEKRFSNR